MKKRLLLVPAIVAAILLQGCVAVAVGTGAAVAAKAATDPRSIGKQVDDTTLDSRIGLALDNNRLIFSGARIGVTAYQGAVLLTGQAKNREQIQKAGEIALSTKGVSKVYNQIRLGPRIKATTLANDAWITAKVKSRLIANNQTKARNIKVVTENSEVFLMGILTRDEAKRASKIASDVAGVREVISAFIYVNN